MLFSKAVYDVLPSSRPVSADRQLSQPVESIVADKFLVPHNVEEARLLRQAAWWEMLGYSVATIIFLAFFLATLIFWMKTFVVPYGTFIKAMCLVLNSTQSSIPAGFNREPLYRAEVYVYVFNTSYTQCCCPNYYGQDRCAEWEALAYDNIMQSYTTGDKTDFLVQYGYPGTFHVCWHSPLKDQVVLVRSAYGEFLMAPFLALVFGLLGLRSTFLKVQTYRESTHLHDKFAGSTNKDDGADTRREELPLKLHHLQEEVYEDTEED